MSQITITNKTQFDIKAKKFNIGILYTEKNLNFNRLLQFKNMVKSSILNITIIVGYEKNTIKNKVSINQKIENRKRDLYHYIGYCSAIYLSYKICL